METKHTPAKLNWIRHPSDKDFAKPAKYARIYTHPGAKPLALVKDDEDARRLVACWNSCKGFRTHELEETAGFQDLELTLNDMQCQLTAAEQQRDALLAALADIERDLNQIGGPSMTRSEMILKIRAAIAQATGQ